MLIVIFVWILNTLVSVFAIIRYISTNTINYIFIHVNVDRDNPLLKKRLEECDEITIANLPFAFIYFILLHLAIFCNCLLFVLRVLLFLYSNSMLINKNCIISLLITNAKNCIKLIKSISYTFLISVCADLYVYAVVVWYFNVSSPMAILLCTYILIIIPLLIGIRYLYYPSIGRMIRAASQVFGMKISNNIYNILKLVKTISEDVNLSLKSNDFKFIASTLVKISTYTPWDSSFHKVPVWRRYNSSSYYADIKKRKRLGSRSSYTSAFGRYIKSSLNGVGIGPMQHHPVLVMPGECFNLSGSVGVVFNFTTHPTNNFVTIPIGDIFIDQNGYPIKNHLVLSNGLVIPLIDDLSVAGELLDVSDELGIKVSIQASSELSEALSTVDLAKYEISVQGEGFKIILESDPGKMSDFLKNLCDQY